MNGAIQKQCRDHLTGEDLNFILESLARGKDERILVTRLLAEKDTRDLLLDESRLVDALMDEPECIPISRELYFYLLVRHCFISHALDDRDVADYVAGILTVFSEKDRMLRPLPHRDFATEWVVDLLAAVAEANEKEAFMIRTHMANYALFMSGLFPGRIVHRRHRRGGPGLRYYEDMGRMGYQQASDSRLAEEYGLEQVFKRLGHWFGNARIALNSMTERFLFLGGGSAEPAL